MASIRTVSFSRDLDGRESRRGLSRFIAAVASTIATAFEVCVEAGDECAAARERFPLAD